MEAVQAQVERHYRSTLVERLREKGGEASFGETSIVLARQFGFCYGVERAIDLAYAARKVFADRRLFLLGEIIHNPDVNRQMADMGIETIPSMLGPPDLTKVSAEDVVIVPAFGAEARVMQQLKDIGCAVVDTTCGDVMSVWRRVRQNATEQVTSIIHGKASHEETRATASRALGPQGTGHYLIVLNLEEARLVADYIVNGGDRAAFLERFAEAHSDGFDPDRHLVRIGMANQTTMLRSETEEIQKLLREAVTQRDGGSSENFRHFDTICGATQERQDALFALLHNPPDLMIVVGGYNSSNTTHLVEIAEKKCPTYFVRGASRLHDATRITHYDIHARGEKDTHDWLPLSGPVRIGITAGASCPNNLIEEVIRRILDLRGEEIPPVFS